MCSSQDQCNIFLQAKKHPESGGNVSGNTSQFNLGLRKMYFLIQKEKARTCWNH
jgi:hypothetical protein